MDSSTRTTFSEGRPGKQTGNTTFLNLSLAGLCSDAQNYPLRLSQWPRRKICGLSYSCNKLVWIVGRNCSDRNWPVLQTCSSLTLLRHLPKEWECWLLKWTNQPVSLRSLCSWILSLCRATKPFHLTDHLIFLFCSSKLSMKQWLEEWPPNYQLTHRLFDGLTHLIHLHMSFCFLRILALYLQNIFLWRLAGKVQCIFGRSFISKYQLPLSDGTDSLWPCSSPSFNTWSWFPQEPFRSWQWQVECEHQEFFPR